jgi:nitrogen fixation/metabolism regulation signal transduction histidine kinase
MTNQTTPTVMTPQQFKSTHKLTERQWRTLRTTVLAQLEGTNMSVTHREGSGHVINPSVMHLLVKHLPTLTCNVTNDLTGDKTVDVIECEVLDITPVNTSSLITPTNQSQLSVTQLQSNQLAQTLNQAMTMFDQVNQALTTYQANQQSQQAQLEAMKLQAETQLAVIQHKLKQTAIADTLHQLDVQTNTEVLMGKLTAIDAANASLLQRLS